MSRGRLQFRNPAEAIAAAKCWLYTWTSRTGPGLLRLDGEAIHETTCSFCEYPRDMLVSAIEEFNTWSAIDSEEEDAPIRLEVEQFLALPAAEQFRLVKKAQATEVVTDEEPWWSAG